MGIGYRRDGKRGGRLGLIFRLRLICFYRLVEMGGTFDRLEEVEELFLN